MALKQWATGRLTPAAIGAADETTYNRHLKRLSELRDAKRNRYNNLMRAFSIETLYVSRGLVPYLTLIDIDSFYDNTQVEEDTFEEPDDHPLFGPDSDDDEPAYE
jgi:hypothetical protein